MATLAGRNYDASCDAFSFGIVVWEMITRKRPTLGAGKGQHSNMAILYAMANGNSSLVTCVLCDNTAYTYNIMYTHVLCFLSWLSTSSTLEFKTDQWEYSKVTSLPLLLLNLRAMMSLICSPIGQSKVQLLVKWTSNPISTVHVTSLSLEQLNNCSHHMNRASSMFLLLQVRDHQRFQIYQKHWRKWLQSRCYKQCTYM